LYNSAYVRSICCTGSYGRCYICGGKYG
jgi:hypothetical protein